MACGIAAGDDVGRAHVVSLQAQLIGQSTDLIPRIVIGAAAVAPVGRPPVRVTSRRLVKRAAVRFRARRPGFVSDHAVGLVQP